MGAIIGCSLNETLARVHFVAIFAGVNVTFFPQHFLGLQGIPRRYRDYPDQMTSWNVISRSGSLISIAGVMFFRYIITTALMDKSAQDLDGQTTELAPRTPIS